MATEWLPETHLAFDALPPPPAGWLREATADGVTERVVAPDGQTVFIQRTRAGGVILTEYNRNQTGDVPRALSACWGTTFVSYLGEPYDAPHADYAELWAREYPGPGPAVDESLYGDIVG